MDVMWMNDLWAVGLTGGCVGATVAWPLLRQRTVTGDVTDGSLRMVGMLLFGGSVATALIAITHSPLPAADASSLQHAQKIGNVVFWSMFTLWIRRSTGRLTTVPAAASIFVVPLLAYAAFVAGAGEPPPFRWLLPIGAIASVHAVICARQATADGSLESRLRTRMVWFAAALCLAQAIRTFWPHVTALREIVPLTMTLGFVSIASLAMRRVFAERGVEVADEAKPSYIRSTLDVDTAAAILSAIEGGMREQHWYRDPDLSLPMLAARVGATPHLVSQALNQQAGRSLSEYLATWRVEEAKRLLLEPANERFTIDGLAHSAGFGSRSAFYKTFKAVAGITPTEYRSRARRQRSG
jgi:AraC-like DNA-binding protein